MGMRRVWLLLAMLMTLAGGAVMLTHAQNEPLRDDALDALATRARGFLKDVSLGNVEEAFESLLAGSPLAGGNDATRSLIEKAERLGDKYGAPRGIEQLSARRIGNDVVILTLLYKCDRLPVVWQFTYYRANNRGNASDADAWHLIALRFDTSLDAFKL